MNLVVTGYVLFVHPCSPRVIDSVAGFLFTDEVKPPLAAEEEEPQDPEDDKNNWDDVQDLQSNKIQDSFMHDSFATSGAVSLVRLCCV